MPTSLIEASHAAITMFVPALDSIAEAILDVIETGASLLQGACKTASIPMSILAMVNAAGDVRTLWSQRPVAANLELAGNFRDTLHNE